MFPVYRLVFKTQIMVDFLFENLLDIFLLSVL